MTPLRSADRDEARRRGGQNRASAVRQGKLVPAGLIDVYSTLGDVLEELHSGALDPKVGTAMAAVARTMAMLMQVGAFEQRIRDIEARLNDSMQAG